MSSLVTLSCLFRMKNIKVTVKRKDKKFLLLAKYENFLKTKKNPFCYPCYKSSALIKTFFFQH